MIPIDVLIRPVTSDDIYEKALDILEALQVPARSWKEGGVAKTVVGVLAQLGAMACVVITFLVRCFFLAFAEKDGLTAHALDVYDVDRLPATFASGPILLTNKGGASYTRGANEVIVTSSNTSARFQITEAFTLLGGSDASPTTITVNARAVDAGSASSVAPAEIDDFETKLGPRVSVTNETSLIGRDEESDDELRKRCSLKKGTWSPFGPRDAYEYAALSATFDDGTPTSISRVWVSPFSSVGRVDIVCATPSGTPSDDELAAVRANVEKSARPDCVTVVVAGAIPHAISHVVTIWANGGAASVLLANAQAALSLFYSTYPIGGLKKSDGASGYVYLDKVDSVLGNSSPEVFDVDFASTADVALAWNEVAVNTTTAAQITVRIR